mmetsp:Transcript_16996/g.46396  ORF Transcript_16996/g.46396 Transcript_16996/m.46396 type:complete len:218 (+) Transcript_16996:809-1462(+)
MRSSMLLRRPRPESYSVRRTLCTRCCSSEGRRGWSATRSLPAPEGTRSGGKRLWISSGTCTAATIRCSARGHGFWTALVLNTSGGTHLAGPWAAWRGCRLYIFRPSSPAGTPKTWSRSASSAASATPTCCLRKGGNASDESAPVGDSSVPCATRKSSAALGERTRCTIGSAVGVGPTKRCSRRSRSARSSGSRPTQASRSERRGQGHAAKRARLHAS